MNYAAETKYFYTGSQVVTGTVCEGCTDVPVCQWYYCCHQCMYNGVVVPVLFWPTCGYADHFLKLI